MKALTARQQQILDLIRQHIATTGFPPTRAEIASALGFRSPNAAEEHLKALARKNAIELSSGTSRGIRLKLLPETLTPTPSATGAAQSGTSGSGRPRNPRHPLPVSSGLHAVQLALTLPLVGRVSAGHPILSEQHVEASYALDPALFASPPDYLLKVRGLSMKDAGILDGDLLAVRSAHEARNGQIVVARIGDEVTVKRFSRGGGGTIELLPENPDFEPIVVDARSDEFRIEGIGVGLIRKGGLL